MRTTTYICDKCKKSVGKDELKTINISANLIAVPNGYRHNTAVEKDFCRTCLKEKGILLEYDKETYPDDVKHNEKTLESKILEILEELGVAFLE